MKELLLDIKENHSLKEQGDLFGIFFEDLNHAADGGLYGELLRNRAFEFDAIDNKTYHAMTAWEQVERGNSMLQAHVELWDPRSRQNPHYLVMEVLTPGEGAGVRNEGYNTGVPIEEGEEYNFYCWCRLRTGVDAFEVRLESADGTKCYAKAFLQASKGEWKKLECTLKAEATDYSARLAILATDKMALELDMVSLFPKKTFNMRENGLRKDIAEMIADLKPKFLRFPGGCLAHIGSLNINDRNAMYRWKSTVGAVEDRPSRKNSWQYNQTYGLGFYEFFLFCEDIGAEALPVVSAGYDPHFLRVAEMDELQEWIDDALDLIEFANGDVSTTWGAVRAQMGHPESFGLKYLAIGNEEVGEEYFERYEIICKAIKEKYPQIHLINSAGPFSAGSEFDKGWEQAEQTGTAYVDEHFYQCPEWFVANVDRYNSYTGKAKAFLGEYASHDTTWWNALAESAFMIGMEKAPGMGLACYAPLLNNVDYTNWKTDMINYDNHRVYGTPSYYIQKLFMNYMGKELVESNLEGNCVKEKQPPVLHGICRMWTDNSEVSVEDVVIHNDDTGEEISVDDFKLTTQEKEKQLADIQWDNYSISFKYRRLAGGTSRTLTGAMAFWVDFAMKDADNRLHLTLDGWQRIALLGGMVNGRSCGMGAHHCIIDKDQTCACKIQVKGNHIAAWVDDICMEHTCLNAEPEEIYYSATKESDGSVIVKLANLTTESKQMKLKTQNSYASVKVSAITDCDLEWRNSLEEPEKVSVKEENISVDGEEVTYTIPKHSFAVLKFEK